MSAQQPPAPESAAPRRRKWDVADPAAVAAASNVAHPMVGQPAGFVQYPAVVSAQPKTEAPSLTPEEAAARATALIQSKMRPPPVSSIPAPHVQPPSEYTAELGINHVRADIRAHLTNRATQEELLTETGASVIVRGVFCAPGEAPPPGEKPIHLLITADTNEKLENAKRKVTEMMKSQSPLTSSGNLVWKIFVGVDNPDPGFGLIGKVLGPKGQYVKHIEQDARVRVQLRGRGAHRDGGGDSRPYDNEPTHLFIQASSGESLEKAKSLAQNLVDHVKAEHDKFVANKNAPVPQPPPPQLGPRGQPAPPAGPPPPGPRPPTSSYNSSNNNSNSYGQQRHHPQPPAQQQQQPYQQQNAYAAYYGAYPGYDYSSYYQAYYGQYNAYYQQQPQQQPHQPQQDAAAMPPQETSNMDLNDSRSIKRNRDESGDVHPHSFASDGGASVKRQKIGEEATPLVSYEMTEEERRQTQKPFWAAPTNEPPPTAYIADPTRPDGKTKDYDKLHEDLMKELGK